MRCVFLTDFIFINLNVLILNIYFIHNLICELIIHNFWDQANFKFLFKNIVIFTSITYLWLKTFYGAYTPFFLKYGCEQGTYL
jgi:hypothetical protein